MLRGRIKRRWETDIKREFKEITFERKEEIKFSQCTVKCSISLKTVMNLLVPLKRKCQDILCNYKLLKEDAAPYIWLPHFLRVACYTILLYTLSFSLNEIFCRSELNDAFLVHWCSCWVRALNHSDYYVYSQF
jgi:hypothetical protein